MKKIYGIDLGTTNSCIAHIDAFGQPVIIPNYENDRVTPSIVLIDDYDTIVVGREAGNTRKAYPNQVITHIKRDIGKLEADYIINEEIFSPEEISAYILRKIVNDAEYKLGEKIEDVVITCPAYFGINEREATKRAGEIAGLNVRAIINEPTAAALAAKENFKESKVVVVFDLGGGTLDITMLEITPSKMKVIVTGGDQNMGGLNWDDVIVDILAQKINSEEGFDDTDNPNVIQDLITRIEIEEVASKAKHSLSVRQQTTASFYFKGRQSVEITRAEFENAAAPLLQKAVQHLKDLLTQATVKGYNYFDEILMVGGATRMPMIQNCLREEFGVPVTSRDPDEAVAKGAAMYGQSLAFADEIKNRVANIMGIPVRMINFKDTDPQLLESLSQQLAADTGMDANALNRARIKVSNVISKSFGVVAYNNESDKMKIYNLITRQSSIPIKVRQRFGTHAHNQKRVRVSVCENLSDEKVVNVENGTLIGDAIIGDLPENLPSGSFIEIDFSINKDGMLEVTGREAQSQQSVKIEIETLSVITTEAVEAAKTRLTTKNIA